MSCRGGARLSQRCAAHVAREENVPARALALFLVLVQIPGTRIRRRDAAEHCRRRHHRDRVARLRHSADRRHRETGIGNWRFGVAAHCLSGRRCVSRGARDHCWRCDTGRRAGSGARRAGKQTRRYRDPDPLGPGLDRWQAHHCAAQNRGHVGTSFPLLHVHVQVLNAPRVRPESRPTRLISG